MKKSKRKSLVAPAIALTIMVAGAALIVARSPDNKSETTANNTALATMQLTPATETAMKTIEDKYMGYSGESYDRYFIATMIAHHQGAVNMANVVLTNAKHQELKDMANVIVTAQTSEINDMLAWQKQWGYPASTGDMMIDHSGMNMTEDMATMTNDLKTLTDNDFDKKFLALMIEHHQSAIAMAKPAATNALHQEVKDLAQAIITAQTSEVIQMQQWQRDWGYTS